MLLHANHLLKYHGRGRGGEQVSRNETLVYWFVRFACSNFDLAERLNVVLLAEKFKLQRRGSLLDIALLADIIARKCHYRPSITLDIFIFFANIRLFDYQTVKFIHNSRERKSSNVALSVNFDPSVSLQTRHFLKTINRQIETAQMRGKKMGINFA